MARVKKYAIRAIGHLLKHYERGKDEDGNYIKFGNRDIDTRWSPLNYRIWPPIEQDEATMRDIFISQGLRDKWKATNQDSEEPALKRFKRIFGRTPHAKRKDLACFCEWCISLPDEIPCDRMGEFFDMCMQYCVSEYGAENIVGGWVHFDEEHRPHLHVAFVPVVTDEDGGKRICAKELLNRKHLKGWHGGLASLLQQGMKIENPGILNGKTAEQGGNRTVKQMKAHDRHYKRTKGREVNAWRSNALKTLEKRLQEANKPRLANMLTDAEERKQSPLKEPRERTLKERLTGR